MLHHTKISIKVLENMKSRTREENIQNYLNCDQSADNIHVFWQNTTMVINFSGAKQKDFFMIWARQRIKEKEAPICYLSWHEWCIPVFLYPDDY